MGYTRIFLAFPKIFQTVFIHLRFFFDLKPFLFSTLDRCVCLYVCMIVRAYTCPCVCAIARYNEIEKGLFLKRTVPGSVPLRNTLVEYLLLYNRSDQSLRNGFVQQKLKGLPCMCVCLCLRAVAYSHRTIGDGVCKSPK